MAFVQNKYYVDSLSENTNRGLRQKVRNGIFPSQAPLGYINDSRTKTIVVEKKKANLVRAPLVLEIRWCRGQDLNLHAQMSTSPSS